MMMSCHWVKTSLFLCPVGPIIEFYVAAKPPLVFFPLKDNEKSEKISGVGEVFMCGLDYKQFLFITIIIIIIIIIKVLLNSETLKMEGLGK
jgi:hypothetical protein